MYKRAIPAAIAAIAATIVSFVMFPNEELGFRGSLAETTVASIFFLAAIYFFLTGLKTFQPRLKVAYSVLSLGIFLVGVAQVQVLYISFYWLWETAWVKAGGTVLPYLLSLVALYLSMYLFARILKIKAFWAKMRYVAPAAVAFAVALSFLPNRFPEYRTDSDLAVYYAVLGMAAAGTVATLFLAMRIKQGLAKAYQPAIKWLILAFGSYVLVAFHEVLTVTFANPNGGYIDYSLWTLDLFGAIMLIAAIRFNELSRVRLAANASYIDVILYTSQLISNPKEIDEHLDKVRLLTSRLAPNDKLSEQDKTTLVDVYLSLEEYLTSKEPIRKLSREDMRLRLPEDFLAAIQSHTGGNAAQTQTA